jgi:RecA/RadA recombinase
VLGVILLTMLFVMLVVWLLVIAGGLATVFGGHIGEFVAGIPGKWIGTGLGAVVLIICAVAAIRFAVRYALVVQACVVETLGVRDSMKRSRALTLGSNGRILTVYFVCWVIAIVCSLMGQGLAAALTPAHHVLARQMMTQLFSLLTGALTAPITTVALCLVYYDERVRKEAFDLQLLMDTLDAPAPIAPEATPGTVLG